MATYDDTFSARPHTLRLTVNQTSQNITNNTSVVSWSLQIIKHPSWSSYSFYANPWSVTIDGVTSSGTFTYDFRTTTSVTLGSGTRTITHNADGTKSIAVSASASGNPDFLGSASVSGTFTLTTIPRASTPSLSPATLDAGATMTINTNRASTSFTHTVTYTFGSASGTIATGVGASTTWVPPLSLLNQIPNALSGTGTITLETFSGTTSIGTRSTTFTLTVPASVVPTLTGVTATENVSSVASVMGSGVFVKTLSRLNVAITGAAAAGGATIASYRITVDGQTINAVSGVTAVLSSFGTLPVVGTVTDSRGRTASATLNITVRDYAPPTINPSTQVRRSDSGGVLDEQGTFFRVDLNASSVSLLNSTERNNISYRVSTRLRGATTWTVNTTATPAGLAYNNFFTISSFAIENSWEVLIEVFDRFITSSLQVTVATSAVFMHWGAGLGLGKFWETGRGSLDAAGQMYQNAGLAVIDAGDIATTAVAGIVELATDAETQTGTDSSRAVTPAALSSRTSTTARTGLVELATNAEAQAGTDASRAVTPAALASVLALRRKHETIYGAFTGGTFNSGIGNSGSVWWGELTVSFGTTFLEIPNISVYCYTGGAVMTAVVTAASTTSFTFRAIRFQAALATGFSYAWSATGRV